MDISSRQIEFFLASAEYGNFTTVAERLYSSQSTVSRQIALLEKELGYDLFIRTKRELQLTPAGSVLREYFSQMMDIGEKGVEHAREIAECRQGSLTLAFFGHILFDNLWDLCLSEFETSHPEISMKYVYYPGLSHLEEKGDADLYFVHGFIVPSDQFPSISIMHAKRCLYVDNGHPVAQRGCITAEDLETYPVLSMFDNTLFRQVNQDIIDYYSADRIKTIRIENMETGIIHMKKDSAMFFGDDACVRMEDRFTRIPFPEDIPNIDIRCCWHKDNYNPVIPSIIRHLQNSCKQ